MLALLCIVQFMVTLDLAVVNVAIPSIQADLGVSQSDLQWVVVAYSVTLGGFLLLGGRAADLLGRRRVLIAGLALFAAASLFAGLATSLGPLVAARGVQGVGAAFAAPAALSILVSTFAEGRARTRARHLRRGVRHRWIRRCHRGRRADRRARVGVDLPRQRSDRGCAHRRGDPVRAGRRCAGPGVVGCARRGDRHRRPDGAGLRDEQELGSGLDVAADRRVPRRRRRAARGIRRSRASCRVAARAARSAPSADPRDRHRRRGARVRFVLRGHLRSDAFHAARAGLLRDGDRSGVAREHGELAGGRRSVGASVRRVASAQAVRWCSAR